MGRVVSEELRKFLQSERVQEEFRSLLADMTFEIKAEVRLVPNKKLDPESGQPAASPAKVEINARRGRRSKKES